MMEAGAVVWRLSVGSDGETGPEVIRIVHSSLHCHNIQNRHRHRYDCTDCLHAIINA